MTGYGIASITKISRIEDIDFSEIEKFLGQQETVKSFDFKELVERLITGEDIDKKWLFEEIKDVIVQEISQSKEYMVQIVLLAAAFALLYNFANVFENASVTDISFYIVYMILLALLMKSFLLISSILNETMQGMLDFMKVLLPTFCFSMMFSASAVTSAGFYQLILILIYVIEAVLMYVVMPAVHIYIMLEMLNHLTGEEIISRLTGLLKGVVEWILKFLFTAVVGINVVQGLLTPVIDSFKTSMFARTTSMLPGVGASVSAVTEIMVGSGMIIKNGMGVAGILILLVLCAGPLIKVGIMTLLYKITAAVIQPMADKRLTGCISGMGTGAGLFGKVLLTANVMLLVTIALVTAATTWNR